MNRLLNNKGYMLVEIILASVLAMGIAYFMTDMTIKLKNKNDDLLVKTLVSTDQAIIYNTIMKDLYENVDNFSCSKIKIENNKFIYDNSTVSVISDYADVGNLECNDDYESFYIKIPIKVKQLTDDFSVRIGYQHDESDLGTPTCSLSVNGSTKEITATVTENGSGIQYSGWNSNKIDGNGSMTTSISDAKTYTYYVKDMDGNEGSCSLDVVSPNQIKNCDTYYRLTSDQTRCYTTTNATSNVTVSGSCTCRDPNAGSSGYTYGVCEATGCSCNSGLIVRTDNCSVKTDYSCSSGTLSGAYCYFYRNYYLTYACSDSSYILLNDNSYCYKIK